MSSLAVAGPKKKGFSWRRTGFILSFLLIPTIHFVVFYIYVNFNSFLMAFQQEINGEVVWGFDNFARFFNEFTLESSEIRLAMINTAKTFGIQLCLFPIGLFVSYFLYKKIWGYQIFRILFFLPSVISSVIICSIYMRFLDVNGFVAKLVQNICNLDYTPDVLSETRFANIFVWINMIWLSFPGNMIIWGGTFSRIPDSVLESARLDGVNWLQEAFRIIIPVVWPTFALQFLLMFSGFFGASGNVFLLTQGGQWGTQTLSNWMYMQVYGARGGPGDGNAFNYLAAVGMFITTIAIIVALTIRKVTGVLFSDVEY